VISLQPRLAGPCHPPPGGGRSAEKLKRFITCKPSCFTAFVNVLSTKVPVHYEEASSQLFSSISYVFQKSSSACS
jgi:hypothetical protein